MFDYHTFMAMTGYGFCELREDLPFFENLRHVLKIFHNLSDQTSISSVWLAIFLLLPDL